jgi:acyl-CoA thioester hydrolase
MRTEIGMAEAANTYPHSVEIEVAFRDLDALGHVNNAVYLSYLETARIKYVTDLLGLKNLSDMPIILGEVTISFRSPALFGERLTIGSGITRFGGKSFDMVHQIQTSDGRLIATSKTVLVMYDYAAGRSIVVPDWFKQRVRAFQGGWEPPSL